MKMGVVQSMRASLAPCPPWLCLAAAIGGCGAETPATRATEQAEAGHLATRADYNGDGASDLVVYRPTTNTWWISTSASDGNSLPFGRATDAPVPEDYDGDGITDLATWRPSTGEWSILSSASGNSALLEDPPISHGRTGDQPIPADYNGDGRADLAYWRPHSRMMMIRFTGSSTFKQVNIGAPDSIPVSGDYDGDGAAEAAVWSRSDFTFRWTNVLTGASFSYQWGAKGDIPVPADYDGDGKADLAIWRPGDRSWWVLASGSGNKEMVAGGPVEWGIPGDIPVPADYGGAGYAQFTVWRPSDGTTYSQDPWSGEVWWEHWGERGDIPAVWPARGSYETLFSLDAEYVVQGGSVDPDSSDGGVLISGFDNPIIDGHDSLTTVTFNGKSFPERADGRFVPSRWALTSFDLRIFTSGRDADGARTVATPGDAPPGVPRVAQMFEPGNPLPFRVRGVQLGYTTTSLRGVHSEITANRRELPTQAVRLAPQTILVPVQVIRALPPSGTNFRGAMEAFTTEQSNRLFDDVRDLTMVKVMHPGGEVYVQEFWQDKGVPYDFTQPDKIWAQCGIQFRAISCAGRADEPGRANCPDLVLTDLAHGTGTISAADRIAPRESQCDLNSFIANANFTAAKMLPGVDSMLPRAVFTYSVSDRICGGSAGPPQNLARAGEMEIAVGSVFDVPFAVAHELGHVLGLADLSCRDGQKELMCTNAAQQNGIIPHSLCLLARENAARFATRKWGVTVDPAVWTPSPVPTN